MKKQLADLSAWWTLILALAGIGLGFYYTLHDSRPTLLERAQQSQTIRLAYAPEAPYAFLDANGEVTGAWPEVARKVLARMGVRKTQWIQSEFGSLLDDLNTGRCDIVAMGMSVTPQRQAKAAFSLTVSYVQQGLILRKDDSPELTCYADAVGRNNVRIAVLKGAIEVEILRSLGMPEKRLVVLPDVRSGIAALKGKEADGLALTLPTARYLALSDPALRAVPGFAQQDKNAAPYVSQAAYALRREDREFLERFNAELGAFLTTPEYATMIQSFGFDVPPQPETRR